MSEGQDSNPTDPTITDEQDILRRRARLHEIHTDPNIPDAEVMNLVRRDVLIHGLWPNERMKLLEKLRESGE